MPKSASAQRFWRPFAFMENLYFIKSSLLKGFYARRFRDKGASASCCSRYRGSRRSSSRTPLDSPGSVSTSQSDELTGNDAMSILSRVTGPQLYLLSSPARCCPSAHGRGCGQDVRMVRPRPVLRWIARAHREFPDVTFHDSSLGPKLRIGVRFVS